MNRLLTKQYLAITIGMDILARVSTMACALVLTACTAIEPRPSEGHIQSETLSSETAQIPKLVTHAPILPPPEPTAELETYDVVVTEVPVKELLFTIARDAHLNIDIHPSISGEATLNAIDQTLPQILNRISKQVDLRYELDGPNLVISPDLPYFQIYNVDYVNMTRDSKGTVSVATQIATTGGIESDEGGGSSGVGGSSSGGNNNSTTSVSTISNHHFWETLISNIKAIIGSYSANNASEQEEAESSNSTVFVNPESGIISVRATSRQHEEIQALLDKVLTRSQRQVLIETTVVEVELNDRYQAGVDWALLRDGGQINFEQSLLGANLAASPFTLFEFASDSGNSIATLRMLEEFGDVKVLSSPKLMVLNNQTALLKVVDNRVYFTTESEVTPATNNSEPIITFTTTIHTVPVGLVMTVTPQIDADKVVTLNVRPTISRIIRFVKDPNPQLASAGVVSEIPEIQVREMESILRVESGQVAVLGGLMQDTVSKSTSGVPFLARLPVIGAAFSYRDRQIIKSELIIFLRPVVVHNADTSSDLKNYQQYLPSSHDDDVPLRTGLEAR